MTSDNSNLITLFEWHKTKYIRSIISSQTNNDLTLSYEFIRGLDEFDPEQRVFIRTENTITPQKFIGYIQIADTTIQILPKFKDFSPDGEDTHIKNQKKNLLLMLSYGLSSMYKIDFINYKQIQFLEDFDNFFEILILFFTSGLEKLLVRHQNREYVNKSGDLTFLKGKINTYKFICSSRIHLFPCKYFEISSNTLINRTLKYCNSLLPQYIPFTQNGSYIRKKIKNINTLLEIVDYPPVQLHEIKSIHFNRLNKDFEPYIRFCELFLSHRALSMDLSNFKTFSFLFPMQDVYQNFITRILEDHCKEYYPGYQVCRQDNLGDLISIDDKKGLFGLRPDIIIKSKKQIELIIDLKYKKIDTYAENKGVKNSDIYQMYAYGTKTGCNNLCLLYPDYGNQKINHLNLKWFFENSNKEKTDLYIKTIDISGDLSKEENFQKLTADLFDIIKQILPE